MKTRWFTIFSLSLLPSVASAQALDACLDKRLDEHCLHYLNGVVDGALMYQSGAPWSVPESKGFQGRALKYRSGNLFEDANRRYCADRIPDRKLLVNALVEALGSGEVGDQTGLTEAMHSLLDCQRME